jgi:hypothetical protein
MLHGVSSVIFVPSVEWVLGGTTTWLKQLVCEADYSPSSSSEDKTL